jgi:Mn-dependent DtxR family transcriptional regulator
MNWVWFFLKSYEETLEDLKKELLRIGSTKQRVYDLLKKKGQVLSTAICRRLKLSWPEVVEQTGVKLNKRV